MLKAYMLKLMMVVAASFPAMLGLASCNTHENKMMAMEATDEKIIPTTPDSLNGKTEIATFGNGCFWCTEALFQQLEGVVSVTSGYSGGHVKNPTYEEVCNKTTGHAEVIQIEFDPAKITFDELLEVFWETHDPTTLNKQGNDEGPQYRSVVFYHSKLQKERAEHFKQELDKSGAWSNPVVTAVEPFKNFYAAENYHQNYYKLNGSQPYCHYVIRPKVEKFQKVFKNKLKH